MNLTEYQAGQLVYIHFHGDFKYKSDTGTQVSRSAWRAMIDTLLDEDMIRYGKRGERNILLTAKGQAYVDANHLSIKALN